SSSLDSALRGRKFVALFASKASLRRGVWKRVFSGSWNGVVKTMLKDADPGPLGKALSSYTGVQSPRRVGIVALPDTVSRHAAPSRSDAAACTSTPTLPIT
ncbi:MAG: hypothetical protein IIB28_00670, partial [Chloroflexi bacterium]|nr:hypothetical protein [Chloroflexota bacterium]